MGLKKVNSNGNGNGVIKENGEFNDIQDKTNNKTQVKIKQMNGLEKSFNSEEKNDLKEINDKVQEYSSKSVKNLIDVRVYPYKHLLPVHTVLNHSALSKESPPQDYRGFFTLVVLVLIATNSRLVIENYLKYGVLLQLPTHSVSMLDWLITLSLIGYLVLTIIVTLYLEKKKSPDNPKPLSIWRHLQIFNLILQLIIPSYVVYYFLFNPMIGSGIMLISMVLLLKNISFVVVNQDLKMALKDGDKVKLYSIAYPKNLNMYNYGYFLAAPTLCYQPDYPRSPFIRKTFVVKRLLEILGCVLLMYFLVVQYAVPILKNSSLEDKKHPMVFLLERVLKLSTISVTVWLLGFYALFHAWLNLIAELLRFGDRHFYLPWWNSTSLSQYWRLWNQPVHHWMKRHLYVPCVNAGYPSSVALLISFFLSAIFHEVLFGIPIHSIQGYAFWGMLGQIPLIMITDFLKGIRGVNSSIGNVVFWLSFCILGQPFLVVLYYLDWNRRYPNSI